MSDGAVMSAFRLKPAPESKSLAWVRPNWSRQTAVCIGVGPSLTQQQTDYVRGKARVVAVNNAYLRAPWADVLYAPAADWWCQHQDAADIVGLKITLDGESGYIPANVKRVRIGSDKQIGCWTWHAKWIPNGGNSGFQAVCLAIMFHAPRIILLGYDMCLIDGKAHWHPDHDGKNPNDAAFQTWMHGRGKHGNACFDDLRHIAWRHSVEVFNCTPGSALTCFPMRRIEDVL